MSSFTCQILNIQHDNIDKSTTNTTYMLPDNALAYANGCRVYVSSTNESEDEDDEDLSQGEILCCSTMSQQRQRELLQQQQHENQKSNDIDLVHQLKDALLRIQSKLLNNRRLSNDESTAQIRDILHRLDGICIDLSILQETTIGATVSKLKSYDDGNVSAIASMLVSKWKAVANDSEKQQMQKEVNNFHIAETHNSSFYYTVMFIVRGNQIYVREDIPSEQVKYRKTSNKNTDDMNTYDERVDSKQEPAEEKEASKIHTPSVITSNDDTNVGSNVLGSPSATGNTLTTTEVPFPNTMTHHQNTAKPDSKRDLAYDKGAIAVSSASAKSTTPAGSTVLSSNKRMFQSSMYSPSADYSLHSKRKKYGESGPGSVRSEGISSNNDNQHKYHTPNNETHAKALFCTVYFPDWLVYDDESRDRLYCEFYTK